ncbi:MAG: hypothetical protein RLZZ500_127 [Bacteroidota bacterium]
MKNRFLLFIFTLWTFSVSAIVLPSQFSDGMVLQRNSELKIWGWGTPKEKIEIHPEWSDQVYTTITPNTARWEISLSTPKEGGPYTLKIKGYTEVTLHDILIGEVWLCSGQSNMEMTPAWGIDNGEAEIAQAQHPTIRFFTVAKCTADTPQNTVNGQWKSCTPEVMHYSSAVAYFFAQRLQAQFPKVPIGLIVSAWGGTPAEVWIPEATITASPLLSKAAATLQPSEYGPVLPGKAYNAMIHGLEGYYLSGVLWYQGESNVGSTIYDQTLEALIQSWRTQWKQDFPFYYVQIAQYGTPTQTDFSNPIVRDSQRKALRIPNTQMVTITDVATPDDIHPKNKKAVGIRLANCALRYHYNAITDCVNGPLVATKNLLPSAIQLTFTNGEGLYFKNPKDTQFEIAGADGVYYPANAQIKGATIILKSSQVKAPQRVRFAWHTAHAPQLFNKAQLPASVFCLE